MKIGIATILIFLTALSCRSSETVVKTTTPLKEGDFTAYSGLIAPSAKDYLKMEETKMIRSFADMGEADFSRLPVSVDLSAGLPQAGEQGKQNSCAGWALAFAVKSFQENRELGWGLNEEHLFSPSFVYNQLNGGKDEGVDLVDAMNFIIEKGTVPYRLLPYRENDYKTQPDARLVELAKGFKGLGYRRIGEKKIETIKAYLAAGDPVVMVVEMFPGFLPGEMRRSGNIYKKKRGDSLGHHVLTAVGYDNSKNALKVLNSWGTRWGEKGYGWIDYDFLPKVVKQAFVLYDIPTPSRTLNQYAGLTTGMPPSSLPDSDSLLIVPDEAGITVGDRWLRLADPIDDAKNFFSGDVSEKFKGYDLAQGDIRVMEDLLNKGVTGKIHFDKTSLLPVATNTGVTFGTAMNDVHRIYGKPDHADDESREDTYFFHAISEDWGGISLTKHASLVFRYDDAQTVNFMALESVFKKVKMGRGFEAMKEGERQKQADGTLIKSDDGQIEFVVPPQFSDINKSVWEGTGYGYFIKNPADPHEFLNVKVFFAGREVTDELMKQRIEADLKLYNLSAGGIDTRTFSGIEWRHVSGGGVDRYYGAKGKVICQIQIASKGGIERAPRMQEFLKSLRVR